MSANIFWYELRARRNSVLIWSLSVTALVGIFMAIFPGFSTQASLMTELMAKFPKELINAFGLNSVDLSSVVGYFGFLFTFVQVCLAIQAGNYGFGLVSVEESDLTADFLMTKPVSRTTILNSKLLAALASLIVTDLVLWVISFLAVSLFRAGQEPQWGALISLLLSVLVFQLFFLSVGLVISLLVKRIRSVTPYSLGLGFGMYILSAFSGIFGEVSLEYITPFKHFDPSYIIQNSAWNTPLALLNISISLISLALSYWLYVRRDIPAVS